MSDETLGLDPRWKERVRVVGKDVFVRQEMMRLGFWKPGETLKMSDLEREKFVADLEESYQRLSELRSELSKITREIAGLGDIKALMEIAQERRIERVAKERAERKLRKAEEQRVRQEADSKRRRVTPPHLGPGVSGALIFEGGDGDKLKALGLPVLETVTDLATRLEMDEGAVAWLAYHRKAVRCEHYSRFVVPKRSGGERVISAPKPKLKFTQEWINHEILAKVSPEPHATAFRPGASILENARRHCGKGVVIRLDLTNFFPTYTFPRVRGLFESLGYNPGVSSVLALLCTEAPRVHAELEGESWYVATGPRRLPQGAPTSPALSNLLARRLDRRLSGLIASLDSKWEYSRYADDMVFSHPDEGVAVGGLLKSASRIIDDEGLVLNDAKTAIMRSPHRQIVTGLVVNDTPRIPRRTLRQFRALLHRCDTQGFDAASAELGVDALAHARGYLAFVHMVMPKLAQSIKTNYAWLQ